MKKLIAVMAILAGLVLIARAVGNSGDLIIHARKAEWKMKNTGFGSVKPCDPPVADGTTSCYEESQSLQWECPPNTLDVIPHEAMNYGMFGWRGQKSGEVHPDVYCLFAVDPSVGTFTAN